MQRNFSALEDHEFDLAIIGGGATGAAIALDASLRGLHVALIDKGDFSSATSAASSKLLHGGLRYLAHGHIKDVREGLRERRHWQRMAAHLVHPLPFTVPTYRQAKPGRALLKLGLYLYDALSFDRNRSTDAMQKMPGFRSLTSAQLLGLVPDLARTTPEDGALTGGLLYHDGQMLSPERLCLAMLRTAHEAGAHVVNYAEAQDFIQEEGRIIGVHVKDGLSKKSAKLHARLTVNAGGPWADMVMQQGDRLKARKKLVRSKGIHIVTRNLTRGAALAAPIDGEHIFVLPWMGRSVLATTDTKFDDVPDAASVSDDDIQALLDKTNRALPAANLTRDDIIYAYVGLRPLVADIDAPDDATYGLSRGSEIYDHAREGGTAGLISALGGKWTTARRLGEQVVDLALAHLGKKPAKKRSADTRLACAPREDLSVFMDKMRAQFPNIETAHMDVLSRLYGRLLPAMMASDTSGLARLNDASLAARIAFAVNDEMAMTLEDVVLRRLVEGQTGRLEAAQISIIADYMAARFEWSAAQTKKQIAALKDKTSIPEKPRARKKAAPKD
jgi:glycerol-3-phosphate dehydrogenase